MCGVITANRSSGAIIRSSIDDQRALHAMAAGELRVAGVEEDHEHPRAGILGLRAHVARRCWDRGARRPAWPGNLDVFEGLDLLRDAVFEDLEVGRGRDR